MSKVNQSDRYIKKTKTEKIVTKKSESLHLNNWQKITILVTLGFACVGAIIAIVYLTVIR